MVTKKKVKKPLFQWCIRETYVSEVLELPKEIGIESITFDVGFSIKRIVATIPQKLRELGVGALREPSTSLEASGVLTGARTTLTRNAKEICSELHLDYRHMKVRRLCVSYHGTNAFFTRMTKNMDIGEEGKTRQVKVLGLVRHDGEDKDLEKIIKLLTARKIRCAYSVQLVTTVVCSE